MGIFDVLGQAVSWFTIPTESHNGPEIACQRMGAALLDEMRRIHLSPSAMGRVGVGSAGAIDVAAGTLLSVSNLKGWENFPLRDRLSMQCQLPVTLANDANAAAYGEFWVGSGRNFRSMVLFTLGTGIGCGIVVGDRVIEGENNHGGECGHIVVDCAETARMCGCGRRGHLEAYASATAVVARTREALAAGRPSSLNQLLEHCPIA